MMEELEHWVAMLHSHHPVCAHSLRHTAAPLPITSRCVSVQVDGEHPAQVLVVFGHADEFTYRKEELRVRLEETLEALQTRMPGLHFLSDASTSGAQPNCSDWNPILLNMCQVRSDMSKALRRVLVGHSLGYFFFPSPCLSLRPRGIPQVQACIITSESCTLMPSVVAVAQRELGSVAGERLPPFSAMFLLISFHSFVCSSCRSCGVLSRLFSVRPARERGDPLRSG